MKLATMVMMGIALMGSASALNAADPVSGPVAWAFTGGSVWTSPSTGTCMWYLPLVGGMGIAADNTSLSLFSDPGNASKDTAYFIWVSDFSVVMLPSNGPFTLAMAPSGPATIYFTTTPAQRNWNERSTWGEPVATFVRNAGLMHTGDNFVTDSLIFSADLVSSTPFIFNGKVFDFATLAPRGVTCFETGMNSSTAEAGTCVAK